MHALIALLAALLAACAAAAPKVPSRSPRVWSDDILYFVLLDRFADETQPTTRMSIARPKAPFTAAI